MNQALEKGLSRADLGLEPSEAAKGKRRQEAPPLSPVPSTTGSDIQFAPMGPAAEAEGSREAPALPEAKGAEPEYKPIEKKKNLIGSNPLAKAQVLDVGNNLVEQRTNLDIGFKTAFNGASRYTQQREAVRSALIENKVSVLEAMAEGTGPIRSLGAAMGMIDAMHLGQFKQPLGTALKTAVKEAYEWYDANREVFESTMAPEAYGKDKGLDPAQVEERLAIYDKGAKYLQDLAPLVKGEVLRAVDSGNTELERRLALDGYLKNTTTKMHRLHSSEPERRFAMDALMSRSTQSLDVKRVEGLLNRGQLLGAMLDVRDMNEFFQSAELTDRPRARLTQAINGLNQWAHQHGSLLDQVAEKKQLSAHRTPEQAHALMAAAGEAAALAREVHLALKEEADMADSIRGRLTRSAQRKINRLTDNTPAPGTMGHVAVRLAEKQADKELRKEMGILSSKSSRAAYAAFQRRLDTALGPAPKLETAPAPAKPEPKKPRFDKSKIGAPLEAAKPSAPTPEVPASAAFALATPAETHRPHAAPADRDTGAETPSGAFAKRKSGDTVFPNLSALAQGGVKTPADDGRRLSVGASSTSSVRKDKAEFGGEEESMDAGLSMPPPPWGVIKSTTMSTDASEAFQFPSGSTRATTWDDNFVTPEVRRAGTLKASVEPDLQEDDESVSDVLDPHALDEDRGASLLAPEGADKRSSGVSTNTFGVPQVSPARPSEG